MLHLKLYGVKSIMNLGLIDIGGTTIKFGIWKNEKLVETHKIETPGNIEDFYQLVNKQIKEYQRQYTLEKVGISSPGAVDQKAGIIRGASAIPYIHNFKIVDELEKRFNLPVSIENDANCAALAELKYGAAKGKQNVVLLVLGSGVGGSIILNGKVYHGSHLLGGEFGYMLTNNFETVSQTNTVVEMAKKYNQHEHPTDLLTGKDIFKLVDAGDKVAKKYVDKFYYELAKTIFNIQYSIDPEIVLLGGGVSENPNLLVGVELGMQKVAETVEIAELLPVIRRCQYKSESNLIGAAVNAKEGIK